MKQFLVFLVELVLLVLLATTSGCARPGYPTGGPKDEEPPVALGCKPANESRNFNAKEFYIQFNEYVVLKNASENVLVSPPMKNKPEFTTKGKGVLVKINDTLQANTTYLFQFKEAIADFTEGNLLPSYEYVFSTGADMDTMSLNGQVIDARSGNPWKETVTVMAYKDPESDVVALDDTIATFVQPDFVTRCDKEGHFAFHYIPEGSYRLVALEDKNRNLSVDVADAVAWDTAFFKAHPIPDSTQAIKQSSNQAITLFISQPDNTKQRITKSGFAEKGRIVVATQLPLERPTIEGLEAEWRLNSRRDTLTLWCIDAKLDSARFVVSDPSGIQDTLRLRYTQKIKGGRRKVGANESKTPLIKALCDGNKAYYDDLKLAFTNPIVSSPDSSVKTQPAASPAPQAEVMLMKDSTVRYYPITVDSTGLIARIEASLKSGEKYHVHIADSLFTDLYGNFSDSLSFDLTPKDYGILSIDIENLMEFPLVIEVLDKRDTVIQQQGIASSGKLRFTHLPSGDYRLRAVIDRNGDGRWTPGDYRQQRLPEESVFFEKTLNLREKWEMEETWVVKKREQMETMTLKPLKEISPEGIKFPTMER